MTAYHVAAPEGRTSACRFAAVYGEDRLDCCCTGISRRGHRRHVWNRWGRADGARSRGIPRPAYPCRRWCNTASNIHHLDSGRQHLQLAARSRRCTVLTRLALGAAIGAWWARRHLHRRLCSEISARGNATRGLGAADRGPFAHIFLAVAARAMTDGLPNACQWATAKRCHSPCFVDGVPCLPSLIY